MDRQSRKLAFMAAGLLGVVLCAVSGIARLAGLFTIAGIGSQSVMIGGIALMVLALFGKQYFVDD